MANSILPLLDGCNSEGDIDTPTSGYSDFKVYSMGYRIGFYEASSFGTALNRRRPHLSKRRPRVTEEGSQAVISGKKECVKVGQIPKRKASEKAEESEHLAQRQKSWQSLRRDWPKSNEFSVLELPGLGFL